jgi:isopentenyl-diphosphate delta-isomerase
MSVKARNSVAREQRLSLAGGAVTSREHLLVELVDETGTAIGACSVAEAHTAPGRRHRAFSVLLYDRTGRVLLQRRATVKTRFASRWSNTCCGHPAPGQDTTTAAARRLSAELGLTPDHTTPLAEVGVFRYHAADPGSGRVEREWDHILVATLISGTPMPDEAEVSDFAWAAPDPLRAEITTHPDVYTPWLPGVLSCASSVL